MSLAPRQRRGWNLCLAAAALFGAAVGCDQKPPGSPGDLQRNQVGTSSPSALRLRIEGQFQLAAVGETGQLVAKADLTDGTEKIVTDLSSWSTADPFTVQLVGPGVVRGVDLGRATVNVAYGGLKAQSSVTVTPPGTFAAGGRLREPGSGNLANVRITEASSGVSRISGDGNFTIGGLTSGLLTFSKDGYETAELVAGNADGYDVPMQKVIRLLAGTAVSAMVAGNDINYAVAPGVLCAACKRIRLITSSPGTVDLRLTWTAARPALSVWVGGQQFSASALPLEVTVSVPVSAGETFIYVGGQIVQSYESSHVAFTLTASQVR